MSDFEETLADVDDLLVRLRGWKLSGDQWSALHTELGHLADALAQRDVHGARLALGRVELAGPMLGAPALSPTASVDGTSADEALPQVVNQTVLQIGAIIAEAQEPTGDETPGQEDPTR